jgi:ribosomal-protein-serine acetyltransferase
MLEYAFSRLMLNKVEIRCATGNLKSCAIPQRLGFKQEGIIRQGEWLYDHFVDLNLYGLLVGEWMHSSLS